MEYFKHLKFSYSTFVLELRGIFPPFVFNHYFSLEIFKTEIFKTEIPKTEIPKICEYKKCTAYYGRNTDKLGIHLIIYILCGRKVNTAVQEYLV